MTLIPYFIERELEYCRQGCLFNGQDIPRFFEAVIKHLFLDFKSSTTAFWKLLLSTDTKSYIPKRPLDFSKERNMGCGGSKPAYDPNAYCPAPHQHGPGTAMYDQAVIERYKKEQKKKKKKKAGIFAGAAAGVSGVAAC